MGQVSVFLVVLLTLRSSAQDDKIYPWEDDYASQSSTTLQPAITELNSTIIYPWEDDFTSQEITTQIPQGTSTVGVITTELYPWEDALPGLTSDPPSTASPTWTTQVTSGIYPWEDDLPSQTTKPPNTNNPTTTFWTEEPTTSSRPSWTTTTQRTTENLFQIPTFAATSTPYYHDPCRGLGLIRQLICLARNLNPSIGISLSSGFGKK